MSGRTGRIERVTGETSVSVDVNLDGTGVADVQTGIGFLDHLLTTLSRHARIDLTLRCEGDLEVDDHHTVEDCALAMGAAVDRALAERRGITRFGFAYAPLDDALARSVIDISGRPHSEIDLGLTRETLGQLATENVGHFLTSMASTARLTLHVDVLRGRNDHHRAEAAFKATALALRAAVAPSGYDDVPSTKGVLEGGSS